MFGIGFPELLVILVIALMVIGPKKLPDIARALGRAMAEFKRATDDFKRNLAEETRTQDLRDQILSGGKLQAPDRKPAPDPYPEQAKVMTDVEREQSEGLGPVIAATEKQGSPFADVTPAADKKPAIEDRAKTQEPQEPENG